MKKNLTIHYALVQMLYWMGFASIIAFASYYLLEIGITNSFIGVIVAAGGLLSSLCQPIMGTLMDNSKTLTDRKLLYILGIVEVAIAVVLMVIPMKNLILVGICYGCWIMFLQLMQPFINTLGMVSINRGYKLTFGFSRACGSMGYAISAYIIGMISGRMGIRIIPVSFLIFFSLLNLVIFIYPMNEAHASNRDTKKGSGSALAFFRKYKKFSVMLLGLILIYFSHVILNSFLLQILQTKGGSNPQVGTATAIAAVAELITMLLFSFYMKKVSLARLHQICGVFFTLKAIGSLLVPNIISFYFIQILQMFAWGILAVGLIYYVNQVVDEEDCAKGQAYATVTYTLGSVFGNFFGGRLIDLAGVNAMMLVGIVAAVIGCVTLFFTTQDKAKVYAS